jgi:hypothetical protein
MSDEKNCIFIGSVVFRKSCDVYSLKDNGNYIDDINFNILNDYNLIYIKTDYLKDFYNNLDRLTKKIILVSGCSDYTIPNDIMHNDDFEKLLNNEKIIHFYAQNCIYKNPKITNLPIGLDYHTMSKYNIYWGNIKSPIEQENELLEIQKIMKPFYERQVKIYSNCHFFVNTKFGYDRTDALNNISKEILFLEPNQVDRKTSWNKQINYSFVLSPHGNGLDCHRTWEALVLGCIPIVKKSLIDDLYKDLPVLIVDDWSEINMDLLVNIIKQFKNINFNYKKIELKYWIDNMKTY